MSNNNQIQLHDILYMQKIKIMEKGAKCKIFQKTEKSEHFIKKSNKHNVKTAEIGQHRPQTLFKNAKNRANPPFLPKSTTIQSGLSTHTTKQPNQIDFWRHQHTNI